MHNVAEQIKVPPSRSARAKVSCDCVAQRLIAISIRARQSENGGKSGASDPCREIEHNEWKLAIAHATEKSQNGGRGGGGIRKKEMQEGAEKIGDNAQIASPRAQGPRSVGERHAPRGH
jgi:hypothetical protein